MPVDLTKERVLVALFVQEGCGACEEFQPRFDRLAARYKRAGMPVFVYDAAGGDPELVAWMDRYEIGATPTILVLKRGPGTMKIDGAIPDDQIEGVLQSAYRVHLGR